jgi:hypothetical protein
LFLPCGIGGNSNQSVDVEVVKIAIFWKTKNSYNQYIQSGFGRLFLKVQCSYWHPLFILANCILVTSIA